MKKLNTVLLFLKNNWCLLSLTLFFIIGLFIGTLLYKNSQLISNFSKEFTSDYLKLRLNGSFFSIFWNSFFLSFVFLFATFVFGTSIAGISFVPIILMIRGVLFSCLSSVFYQEYNLLGVSFNALILIPTILPTIVFLILSAKQSLLFSLTVAKITMPKTIPKNLSVYFGDYCKKYFIFLIPTILAGILDAILSMKLLPFFKI